jgi:hypothetical protein
MQNKLRIGTCSQLTDVHALPVAVCIDAEADEAVEQKVRPVKDGEHDADERGDANELAQDEHSATDVGRTKESVGKETPQTGSRVDRDCATGIIDEELQLERLDKEGDEHARNEADDDGCKGRE